MDQGQLDWFKKGQQFGDATGKQLQKLASGIVDALRNHPPFQRVPALAMRAPNFASVTASSSTASELLSSYYPSQSPSNPKGNSKEELGRSTWTLLHTLAAQYPDHPTKQQQRDTRSFITSLSKVYPCGECSKHFQAVIKKDPPPVRSGAELQQWLCRIHNVVNRRLGKPSFNCDFVGSRWAPLDCGPESSCDMTLGRPRGK